MFGGLLNYGFIVSFASTVLLGLCYFTAFTPTILLELCCRACATASNSYNIIERYMYHVLECLPVNMGVFHYNSNISLNWSELFIKLTAKDGGTDKVIIVTLAIAVIRIAWWAYQQLQNKKEEVQEEIAENHQSDLEWDVEMGYADSITSSDELPYVTLYQQMIIFMSHSIVIITVVSIIIFLIVYYRNTITNWWRRWLNYLEIKSTFYYWYMIVVTFTNITVLPILFFSLFI